MPDPVSAQTPEPYTPTTQLPLRAIKKRYAEATKVTNDSGSLLELYAESAHDVPVLIAEVEKLRRALVRGAAHDREVAKRAWNKGYAAGEDDEAFLSRGLRTDADANEHPHTNPYTEESQND